MRYLAFALGLLSVVTCQSATAQVIQQFNQVRVGAAGLFGMDEEELQAAMRVEVDTIRRVTGISDASAKKLDVAAKAAIAALKKKSEANAQGIPRPYPPKAPTAGGLSDEDAEKKAAEPVLDGPVMVRNSWNTTDVKNEEIWRKTYANVLDDQQQKKYEQHQAERADRHRAHAVENYVDQLDSYLILDNTQREAITKIVDREIGEVLARQRSFQRFGQFGAMVMMAGMGDKNSVKPEDLREILSPVQLEEMKRQQELMDRGQLNVLEPKKPKKDAENPSLFQSSLGFGVAEEENKLVIREVKPDTPAESAGVQVGDVIDSFDETPIDTLVQLKRAISKSNKNWTMQVRRQDKLMTVSVP